MCYHASGGKGAGSRHPGGGLFMPLVVSVMSGERMSAPAPESYRTDRNSRSQTGRRFSVSARYQPMDLDLEEDFRFKRLKAMYRSPEDCGYTCVSQSRRDLMLTPPGGSRVCPPKAA